MIKVSVVHRHRTKKSTSISCYLSCRMLKTLSNLLSPTWEEGEQVLANFCQNQDVFVSLTSLPDGRLHTKCVPAPQPPPHEVFLLLPRKNEISEVSASGLVQRYLEILRRGKNGLHWTMAGHCPTLKVRLQLESNCPLFPWPPVLCIAFLFPSTLK